MYPILNIAIRAVRKAGNFISKYYENPDFIKIVKKNVSNFITDIYSESERLIIEVIRKYYPQHNIIGKESNILTRKNDDMQWIINPLDGIVNFINCFPYFAVSIAVRIKNRTEIAAIYDPIRNELFTASRGQGTQLNGYRLRGSAVHNIEGATLATSFPVKQKQYANSYIALVNKLFIQCVDFRYTGSTTLNLAYVSAGRIDGFFEIALKPWDFIGGELLVREAGGLVTDVNGSHDYLISGNIVAGNPKVVKAILLTFRNELNKAIK
ncbi:inositol-1-monophosphatase [Candidatus Gullanella endobia]|nr:inositol-1-monophosphatase [Candidatus Gullanella endobia]